MKMKIAYIVFLLCFLNLQGQEALEKLEQQIQQSKDLVAEANDLVNDYVIEAEKEYRKAISKAPSYAVGKYNLGNALYNSGHHKEALIKHLEAAENSSDKFEKHKAFHNAGNILIQDSLCQEAVEMYKNALRNNPSDDETRYNLAVAKDCAEKQGGGGEDDEEQDDKKEDENKDEENSEQEQEQDEQENEGDGEDKEDQNEGDEQEDENGKPNDEKDNKNPNKQDQKEQPQAKQQPSKLSPQQIKNLLEAMNNQEKKVQDKINAKKVKGVKVKTEKDW